MTTPKNGDGFYPTLGIIAIIFLACVAMLVFLQPGLPTEPDISIRMRYIHDHRNIWLISWFLWMASAFGLLLFSFYLLPFLPKSKTTYYAVAIIAIGIVPDVTAEFIFAVVLPWIASRAVGTDNITLQTSVEHFRMFEYLATQLTGGFGNGAYNIGGLTLNVLGFRNVSFPRWLLWLGLPSWVLGLTLSAATIAHQLSWMRFFTAASMALSLIWILLVAVIIFRHSERYQFVQETLEREP